MPIDDDFDVDDTADVLFPSTARGARPAPEEDDPPPPPEKVKSALEKQLFGEGYTEDARMFKTHTALRDVLRERTENVATILGHSEADQQASNRHAVEMVDEAGVDPYVTGRLIIEMVTAKQVEAARLSTKGSEEQEAAVVAEAEQARLDAENIRSTMRGLYGPQSAETLAARTVAWIQDYPKLHRTLDTAGLSKNPKLFLQLCEHVRRHVSISRT